MAWTKKQRNVVVAAYLGWTLDAFDFFLMVFMFKDIAAELHSSMQVVSTAVLLTLAMRPVGAFLFGRLADHFGRKPTLMWNILAYSLLEMASGFAPTMATLLLVRALFGIAMGGEWGIGSALTMETIPASSRGAVSGLLQNGLPVRLFPRLARGVSVLRSPGLALDVRVGSRCRRSSSSSSGAASKSRPSWLQQKALPRVLGLPRAARAQCQAGVICRGIDGRFQLLQSWVAGCLPNVLEGAASFRYPAHFAL